MAEITTKQYASGAAVVEDITPLWDWEKIEETDEGTCFWVNSDAYLRVSSTGKPSVWHKGMRVTYSVYVTNSSTIPTLQFIKAKAATVIKWRLTNDPDLSNEHQCIILGYEKDIKEGSSRATIAVVGELTNTNIAYAYICAKNTSDVTVNDVNVGTSIYQGVFTRMTPFRIDEYPVIMEDVYLFNRTQYSGFFTGDCTINGRKYVAIDFVCVLDE